MKKLLIISILTSVGVIGGCSLINKSDDQLPVSDEEINQIITGQTGTVDTGAITGETDGIDANLEQKVDVLIENAKGESGSVSTGLDEKDVDLINSVINEITESIDSGSGE